MSVGIFYRRGKIENKNWISKYLFTRAWQLVMSQNETEAAKTAGYNDSFKQFRAKSVF